MNGWALVVLGALVVATPASAQYSIVQWTPGSPPMCSPVALRSGSCPGATCPGGLVCRDVNAAGSVCVPDGAVFCVTESAGECPADRPRTVGIDATRVMICVPDRAVFCGLTDPSPCFTSVPDRTGVTEFPVDWAYGDCDGDGLPNGPDPDPCEAPLDVALTTPEGNCELAEPCAVDGTCDPGLHCAVIPDAEPHTYCVPADDSGVVPCCGGFVGFACPDGDACDASAFDDFGFCPDPEYCPDMLFFERVACLSYDGAFPVDKDAGDCDGDLIPNGEDERPCVADEFDAGVPTDDAGPPFDAGNVDAGGGPMDGSIPDDVIPDFRGGSGCACRAAPSAGGGGVWFLGLLGFIAIRRRRRASPRA